MENSTIRGFVTKNLHINRFNLVGPLHLLLGRCLILLSWRTYVGLFSTCTKRTSYMVISRGFVFFFFLPNTRSIHSLQDNVLIDDDHRARLSDFGLANFDRSRWLGIMSNSSDPGGTAAYMAPELSYREHVEGQLRVPLMRKEADVYALGMLMYEVRLLI